MLWGHSIQYCTNNQFDFFENIAFKFIYSHHMPLFMIISGYLFCYSAKKRTMVELVEHKAKSLLYPILMGSACNLILSNGIGLIIGRGTIGDLIEGIPLNSLWFLWSVLSASIVFSFVIKGSDKVIIKLLVFLLSVGMIAIFPGFVFNAWLYPYFILGYLIAKYPDIYKSIEKYVGIVSIVAFIGMLFFFEKKHFIYTTGLIGGGSIADSIKIDVFRWMIGLFGSLSVIYILKLFFKFARNDKIQKLFLCIEKVGEESLGVYVLSVSILSHWLQISAEWMLSNCTWINWNEIIYVFNFIITPSIAIVYAVFLVWLIKKLRKLGIYRIIFGR